MDNVPRITKKQKKALVFRERKRTQPPSLARHELEVENTDQHSMEIQGDPHLPIRGVEARQLAEKRVNSANQPKKVQERDNGRKADYGTRSRRSEKDLGPVAKAKRKRETEQEPSSSEDQAAKRRKTLDIPAFDGEESENNVAVVTAKPKQRFILFLGNLKYTTTCQTIQEHFSVCDPSPVVRLLTPRTQRTITKSKGCAFLEFTHKNALQQALKLHHSELEGRKINVELTAGGGGKSAARLGKLQRRNKDLHSQRKSKEQKTKTDDQTDEVPVATGGSQRFSATGGVGQTPQRERTWTVQDADDEMVHRGGRKNTKKHGKKKGGKTSRNWGSGTNAIPLG